MPDLTEREKLFGSDLQLIDRAGGMDLVPDHIGDLALAQGNENIVQALALRLKVKQGELAGVGWPDYGSRIHEVIGEPNIPRTHARLMAYAREALEPDPRVQEITEIQAVALERDTVRLYIDITLIDQPNPLNLVYDVGLNQP
jgi:phage baseplate assembly protein W